MKNTNGAQVTEDWEQRLAEQLPLLGHRNWIVIADSAYPAYSNAGVEMCVASGDPLDVIRRVIERVEACRHVRPNVYLDLEQEFVDESDAPGITRYRQQLAEILEGAQPRELPHEQIIARLDECARMFRVLIVKTELALPYTSVYLELDCGYWTKQAEQRLREAASVGASE